MLTTAFNEEQELFSCESAHYHVFEPDLIIEATSVCDRSCLGCYAPNVVSSTDAKDLFVRSPSLFLQPSDLQLVIDRYTDEPNGARAKTVSIRGGEPTRHPKLIELLEILSPSTELIYLETHGRWLLQSSRIDIETSRERNSGTTALLRALAESQGFVKISFDRMHGLSVSGLQSMISVLDHHSIGWVIAITEATHNQFKQTREQIAFVPNRQIISQTMARSRSELRSARLGILGTDGVVKSQLSTKFASEENSLRMRESHQVL